MACRGRVPSSSVSPLMPRVGEREPPRVGASAASSLPSSPLLLPPLSSSSSSASAPFDSREDLDLEEGQINNDCQVTSCDAMYEGLYVVNDAQGPGRKPGASSYTRKGISASVWWVTWRA